MDIIKTLTIESLSIASLSYYYFKRTNFRGQKVSRISRILVQSPKVCPAKNFELLHPRKFMFAKCFKIGQNRPKVNVNEKFQKQGISSKFG